MILECDIGNTRCKWRLLKADLEVLGRDSFPHSAGFGSLSIPAGVERIRVASVASEAVMSGFYIQLRGCGIEPEIAVSSRSVAGVVNAYSEPERLGVDRWLAVVAASQRQRAAALVIDVGTALKADLVAADGRHLGGYIAPGAELMKASLQSGTGKVRFHDDGFKGGLALGCSTAEAVNAGVLSALVGSINVAVAEAGRRIPEGFAILLTGGGAETVRQYLQHEVEEVPDLVMDGLRWLLP